MSSLWRTCTTTGAPRLCTQHVPPPLCHSHSASLLLRCRDFAIALHAADSLEVQQRLLGHTRPVLSVALGGCRVVSGGCDGIRIWCLPRGECIGHMLCGGPAFALALHGATLLSGACGETGVRVWDVHAQKLVGRLNGGSAGAIGSVCALACDGQRAASGVNAGFVPQLWDNFFR